MSLYWRCKRVPSPALTTQMPFLEKAPFFWSKLECDGDLPLVRVYHSAALCSTGTANGMMVIFGGRTADQSALCDTWGLRRHRDGRWDWVLFY